MGLEEQTLLGVLLFVCFVFLFSGFSRGLGGIIRVKKQGNKEPKVEMCNPSK